MIGGGGGGRRSRDGEDGCSSSWCRRSSSIPTFDNFASAIHLHTKPNMIPRSARLKLPSSSVFVHARRRLHTPVRPPLKLAIIGAGPSGFYTASRILSSIPSTSPEGQKLEVHMYERLPTPYGLVRYGVAPDHPEVKVCLFRL